MLCLKYEGGWFMKAIVFDNELKLDKNYEKPVPAEGEALIRVTPEFVIQSLKLQKAIWDMLAYLDTSLSGL